RIAISGQVKGEPKTFLILCEHTVLLGSPWLTQQDYNQLAEKLPNGSIISLLPYLPGSTPASLATEEGNIDHLLILEGTEDAARSLVAKMPAHDQPNVTQVSVWQQKVEIGDLLISST